MKSGLLSKLKSEKGKGQVTISGPTDFRATVHVDRGERKWVFWKRALGREREQKAVRRKRTSKQGSGIRFLSVCPEFNWAGDPKEAFELQRKLGEGYLGSLSLSLSLSLSNAVCSAYGSVYKAILKSTKAELAIKSIRLSQQVCHRLCEAFL